MAVDVRSEIDIARPRAEVAAYARDPDNATTWYENIKAVEWMTERPLSVGSKIAFVAQFLGRRLSYTYEIEVLEGDERFVMSTTEGPFPMQTTYLWRDGAAGGTHMELWNRGTASGFSKFVSPFMAGAMRRANRKDLLRLKSVLERGAR